MEKQKPDPTPARQAIERSETSKPAPGAKAPKPTPTLDFFVPPILFEGDEPASERALPAQFKTKVPEPFQPSAGIASLAAPKLTVTARDPFCIYVSWEFGLDRQQRWNALSPDGRLVLRTIMETGERLAQPEVRLNPTSTHWFVTVSSPGVSYTVHLGYYDDHRRWCEVARSESVETPPNAISEVTTIQLANIAPAEPTPQETVAVPPPVIPRLPRPQPAHTRTSAIAPTVEVTVPPQPRAYPPSRPAQISQELGKPSAAPGLRGPAPVAETESHRVPSEAPVPATFSRRASRSISLPVPRALAAGDTRRRTVSEQILYALASSQETRVPGISSAEQTLVQITRRADKLISSQEAITSPGLIEEQPGAEWGAPIVHVSSPAGEFAQPPSPTKDFWLRVNAELVIYGATVPDAQVAISGRAIKLRPDGTFSYRFALPDGDYRLQVVAVSRDGDDERGAALRFGRSTEFAGEVGAVSQDPALRPPRVENL